MDTRAARGARDLRGYWRSIGFVDRRTALGVHARTLQSSGSERPWTLNSARSYALILERRYTLSINEYTPTAKYIAIYQFIDKKRKELSENQMTSTE